MAPIWNPRLVLGIRADDQTEWRCVGTTRSTRGGPEAPIRCDRAIRPSELGKVNKLLAAMSNQMPDQIDHNELLHLARACLCSETSKPHRGAQEAAVIYQWTELMSAEASELRTNSSRTITDADLGLPQSPRAQTTFTTISSPPLYAPKPKSSRMAALQSQPRLVTDLTPEKIRSAVLFPTPIAMDRTPVKVIKVDDKVDNEKWETETVIASPLSSLPLLISPTTAKDMANHHERSNSNSSQSPLSGHFSGSSYSTPATSPSVTVHSPSILQAQTARELPPSPPDSAVSPQAPMSLHTNFLVPQSTPSTVELSPGDRIITTSLVIPANNSLFHGMPLTSPLDIQKLEECSRLLGESRADNRLLVEHISALRSELGELRREQANMQAAIMLLMYIIQAMSCFPLVVMGWVEAVCETVVSSIGNASAQREKNQDGEDKAEILDSLFQMGGRGQFVQMMGTRRVERRVPVE